MIDKSKRMATAKKCGSVTVIHYTGGPDCLWLNMYLDEERGQMTCDSAIGFYAYHWGTHRTDDERFIAFCCRWMQNEEWLLRKCIAEQPAAHLVFDCTQTEKNLRESFADESEEQREMLEEALEEAAGWSYNSDFWVTAFQIAADRIGLELPEEWAGNVAEDYTPWQKRFAEICREVIVPKLKELVKTPEEIKIALACCSRDECKWESHECPYVDESSCTSIIARNALAHINELEARTSLNTLRDAIYEDAVAHGLWEDEDGIDWYQESHSMIECEVDELYDAIEDRVNGHGDEHFTEELADVIIMSMSVAGKLGIDIDAAVRRKMEINKARPWKHGKDEKK